MDGYRDPGRYNLLDDQSVQSSSLCDLWRRGILQMLLLPFTRNRVLVSEDEMNFVG